MVINKKLVKIRFGKAANSYHKAARTQALIAEELMREAVDWLPSNGVRLLEIGCGSGFLTRLLKEHLSPEEWIVNDLSGEWKRDIDAILKGDVPYSFVEGDAEAWPFEGGFDVIASCSTLQWFVDSKKFIRTAYDCLNPNGLLMLSSFGSKNLKEVKELTGKGLDYPDLNRLVGKLCPEAECRYWEQEQEIVLKTPLDVLKHLKATGVTATHSDLWTRTDIDNFCKQYEQRFQVDGGVKLTYHPLYLLIRKK